MAMTTNLLAILALLVSTISLIISVMIAWPNYKDSFAKIRDAVLWVAFIFVVVGMVNYAWRNTAWSHRETTPAVNRQPQPRSEPSPAASASPRSTMPSPTQLTRTHSAPSRMRNSPHSPPAAW